MVRTRLRRVPLRFAIVFFVSASTLEIGFRCCIHDAGSLAGGWSQEYWTLRYRFSDPKYRDLRPPFDSTLSWVSPIVEPETYRHRHVEQLAGRRPVLLFGDSFAFCLTGPAHCWQGLMERSELASEYGLLNYGTGGYGLGQIYLSFLKAIDLYEGMNPIVIFSLFVDDDMDRANLAFREYSLPRIEVLEDGSLTVAALPIEDNGEAVAQLPVPFWSYAWRYLVFAQLHWRFPGTFDDQEETYEETRELARHVFVALKSELEGRGLEHFVVLFHGKSYLEKDVDDWREPFVVRELNRIDLPYVSSKLWLREDAAKTGRGRDDYYIPSGSRGQGHYSPLGNEIVFGAIRSGLAKEFDSPRGE
jgi:hypothetical protein